MKWMKKKKCNNCGQEQGCSECKKYQDRAVELEVDEELQNERLVKFWKKYSWLVYGGIVAILLATVGAEWYRNYRTQTRLKESDQFENATLLAIDGKNAEAISAFEELAKSGKTGYKVLALMNLANLQMIQNKKDESLATLKKVLEVTPKDDPIHLTASLTYAGYQMEDGNPDELLKVLEPALDNESFQGLATELAVQLLDKKGDKTKAQELIQKAFQNSALSVASKARLNTLKGE